MVSKNKQSPYKIHGGLSENEEKNHEKIRKLSKVSNLPAPGAKNIARRTLNSSTSFVIPKTASTIGKGAYGEAYKIQYDLTFHNKLKSIWNLVTGKVFLDFPNIGSDVVIKIMVQKPRDTDKGFFDEAIKENTIHKNLSESPSCALVPNVNPVCISDYIPKFYLSFIIMGDKQEYKSVTVMKSAGELRLKDVIRDISQEKLLNLYLQVERAVCSLWLAGYAHADLHSSNIMVKQDGTNPKIIDFGFGVTLPNTFKIKIAQIISKIISEGSNRSLSEVWTEKINGNGTLQNYSNTILYRRGYRMGYNPDPAILNYMWNKILPSNRKKISVLRAQLWGLKTNIQPNLNTTFEELSSKKRVNSHGLPTETVWPTNAQLNRLNNSNDNSSYPNFFKNLPSNLRKRLQEKSQSSRKQKYNSSSPKYKSYSPEYKPRSLSKSKTPLPNSYPKMPVSPNTPQNEIPNNSPVRHIGKVDKKGRDIFKNDKGRTYVMQNDKKVYVRKMFLPSDLASERMIGTNKVNAKKRKVYENSSGSKYVKSGDKRVRVSRVFNKNEAPKRKPKLKRNPSDPASPRVDTEKVNAKGRKVYRNSDGRTYVLQNGKKVFVKKLMSPKLN
jgi:serine/threonine protein kinase